MNSIVNSLLCHLAKLGLLVVRRKNAWLAAVLCAALLLPGCQHPAQEANVGKVVGPKLSTQSIVYVAVPSDAYYKKELAMDSGRQAAELARDNLAKYVRRAFVGRHAETFAEALETARKNNCTYLVNLWLLQWEDHATEYSGVRDKVEIKIEVADVASGNILHSTTLKGTGPWMTAGGDSPRDILREPMAKYVASIFQVIHTPTALPLGPPR